MSKTLEKRFHELRGRIEGFRAKRRYETNYFIPLEEELGCVPVNRWHLRILSELEFCLQMKAHMGTDVTAPVDAALTILEEAGRTDGALPDSICAQAENCLLPLAPEAKTYHLIMAGHSHIDMNWKWSWDETVATTIATFKTMLKLMEEYPDYHFSQSQAATYKIIEDYAPQLMPEMQKRIKEGRWEVLASTWVEADQNLPCTESFLNQILYAKKYLKEHWDIDPDSLNIDFTPDTFGHTAFLPDIDTLGGIKYMYQCRGMGDNSKQLYRYKSPSGKELLAFREPFWYSCGMSPKNAIALPRLASQNVGFRTGLMVYGVGDHGGGPTRRDLNSALWMQQWPVFPTMRFGSLQDFFRAAESVREKLPIVEHELNTVFAGCYTSQSRIKQRNRRSETALINAETLSALVGPSQKNPYSESSFEKAWQNTLFTHFHDIITGSCVQDTREHAMGLYQDVLAVAGSQASFALESLAESIDTSALIEEPDEYTRSFGAGAGYTLGYGNIPTHETSSGKTRIFHIVNPTGIEREENATLTVWDWPGTLELAEMTDIPGNILPSERITDWKIFWQHRYFELLVHVKVPAYGYTTVILREKDPVEVTDGILNVFSNAEHLPTDDIVLQNKYIVARFDSGTGALSSLIDKETGTERLRAGETGSLCTVKPTKNGMSSWIINRWLDIEPVKETVLMEPINGRLQSGLRLRQKSGESYIDTRITLGSNDRFLKIKMEIDWKEDSAGQELQPLLIYRLPLDHTTDRILCDVPGGALWRPAQETDVPCQRYAAAEFTDNRVLALASDCKHGFRLAKNNLYVTLLNTSEHPDPCPERGMHEISLFLIPSEAKASVLAKETDICLNPLSYVGNTPHPGILAATGSLLDIQSDSAVITGIAQRGQSLAIRMYEADGTTCPVTVTVQQPITDAYLSDLFGNRSDTVLQVTERQVQLMLAPYEQVELRLRTK